MAGRGADKLSQSGSLGHAHREQGRSRGAVSLLRRRGFDLQRGWYDCRFFNLSIFVMIGKATCGSYGSRLVSGGMVTIFIFLCAGLEPVPFPVCSALNSSGFESGPVALDPRKVMGIFSVAVVKRSDIEAMFS